jgi:hypothetical protein
MLTVTILFIIGFIIGLIAFIATIMFRKRMPQWLIILILLFSLLIMVICGLMALSCGYFAVKILEYPPT